MQASLKTSLGFFFCGHALYVATDVNGSQITTVVFCLCLHSRRQLGIVSFVYKHKFNWDDTELLTESD